MLAPKYFLYLATGPQVPARLELSSNPRVDAWLLAPAGYEQLHLFQPPQSIYLAELVLLQLLPRLPFRDPEHFFKLARRLYNEVQPLPTCYLQHHPISELKLERFDPPDLERLFWGKSLLGTEIPELLRSNGFDLPWDPEDWLQQLCLKRQLKREAAVSLDRLGLPYCRRCGSTSGIIREACLFCGSRHCFRCTECQGMGTARGCTPLYAQPYPAEAAALDPPLQLKLDLELTLPQKRAALEVERFLDTTQPEFLVWAVCGAGKTEVSLGAIAQTLNRGGRVLVTVPRRDVLQELAPRLARAFPRLDLAVVYGGQRQWTAAARLTLATTHQCLRYFQAFDLVVLDEADAFPYQGSRILPHAVRRALKPHGQLVILTATPDRSLRERARSGRLAYVSIPARHHGRPLVEPELLKLELKPVATLGCDWAPPPALQQFLCQVQSLQRQALVFLPTIPQIESFGPALVAWAKSRGLRGGYTHARYRRREAMKAAFVARELDFLVTSTILERGVNLPQLDLMVVAADQETVFDSRTLVQIAGRAGRQGDAARVVFAAKAITPTLEESCRWIRAMNQEAASLGYLESDAKYPV